MSEKEIMSAMSGLHRWLKDYPELDAASEKPGTGGKLTNYDGTVAIEIPEEYAELFVKREVLYLERVDGDTFFITDGAVDDRWGYAFSDDEHLADYLDAQTVQRLPDDESGLYVYSFSSFRDTHK